MAVITHQNNQLPEDTLVKNLTVINTSAAVSWTALSTVPAPFIVTVKPGSANFVVRAAVVVNDGLSFTESFLSDV